MKNAEFSAYFEQAVLTNHLQKKRPRVAAVLNLARVIDPGVGGTSFRQRELIDKKKKSLITHL